MALTDNQAIINIKVNDDTAGADKAEKEIKDVGDATEEAGKKAKNAGFDFKEFAKNASIGSAAVFGAAGLVAKLALDSASQFEQQQVAFNTLLGNQEAAQAALKGIEDDAKKTPFNLPELIKANQMLISAGENADDSRKVIKDLGNAISATGGGTAELTRMAQNLQQIKAVGKATAMDVKQFGYAGINIYKLLADASGLPIEKVKEMDVSYEDLTNALASASAAGGMFEGAMEDQSSTLQGTISNIQDAIGIGLKNIAVDSGLFDAFKEGASTFLGIIEGGIPTITEWIKQITGSQTAMLVLVGIIGGLGVAALIGFLAVFGPIIIATLTFAAAGAGLALVLSFLWPVIQTVTNFLMEHQTILAFVAGFIGTIVINTIKNLIVQLIRWAAVQIATVIPAIVSTVIAMGPLILVALAVGAVIALLYTAWKNNWLGMRDTLKPIVDSILSILKPVIDFIGKIIEGLKKLAGIKGSGVENVSDFSTNVPNFSGGGGNFTPANFTPASGGGLPAGLSNLSNFQTPNFNPGNSTSLNVTNNNYSQVDLNAAFREMGFDLQTAGG